MEILEQLLYETCFSTGETVDRIKGKYEDEIKFFEKKYMFEIQKIRNKYYNSSLSNEEMMKKELTEYMHIIIKCINDEYGDLIPINRLKMLNNMLSDGIVVIYDENEKHDFSADSTDGHVIVNLAKIGREDGKPLPDIYTQIVKAKGTLPHELFHIVIQMLKPKDVADERMVIDLKSGESLTSRGMVGFILNEGFVEKYSEILCKKHNLYYQKGPQYIPFVNLCDYIMAKYPSVNTNTIFSLDESDVLSYFNDWERNLYYDYECISYAVRHGEKKREDIASSHIESVDVDYSSLSQDEIFYLQDYYLEKNSKLAQTSSVERSRGHL